MRTGKKSRGSITPVVLDEVYAQIGNYSAKMMIDPVVSSWVDTANVSINNSDGSPVETEFKRWGTKLTFSFKINEKTPDGVAIIDIRLSGRGKELQERFSIWIIK